MRKWGNAVLSVRLGEARRTSLRSMKQPSGITPKSPKGDLTERTNMKYSK